MPFKLVLSLEAKNDLDELRNNPSFLKCLKAVRKALGYLENNPRHLSLNAHKYNVLSGPNGEDVFEAYADNHTPGAYRIFWYYGENKNEITILAITSHP